MKITTTTEKFSQTTTISKSFTTKTSNGFEIILTVYRRTIAVGSKPFISPIYFGVSFRGHEFGHNDMDRQSLDHAIQVINKWGNNQTIFQS
jgi:hypothetical protein